MSNSFVSKLTPKNPLPANAHIEQKCPANGEFDPDCGYAVLSRADPASYDRDRRQMTPLVHEFPNISTQED